VVPVAATGHPFTEGLLTDHLWTLQELASENIIPPRPRSSSVLLLAFFLFSVFKISLSTTSHEFSQYFQPFLLDNI